MIDIERWLNNNPISIKIWKEKYQNENETPDEWLDRVSGKDAYISQLILEKKFLFGGRTLANRGTSKGSFSNCYSSGFVKDSLPDIMDTATNLAKTYKAQGGQGVSLSHIRPKGAPISGGFISDGIVPFMEIFNTVTNSISQGGSRKGALMMSCDVWHRDIKDFITIKSQEGKIDKANLSVEIDGLFMKYVENYIKYGKDEVITITKRYSSYDAEHTVRISDLYNLICKNAHQSAEPGIIFTERFRNYNIMEFVGDYKIETCNPCGEQPLPAGGACNLCSINLAPYVLNPFTTNAKFDYDSFIADIPHIVRAMDDVLEENLDNHPLPIQKKMAETYRNIGIGFMGFADAMMMLRIKYGSKESIEFTSKVTSTLFRNAVLASVELAKERGNFPGYDTMVWKSSIMRKHFTSEELATLSRTNRLRNCSLLSIAPTGSLSTMLNCSGGIEPSFALSYQRRTVSLEGREQIFDIDIDVVKKFKELYPDEKLPDYFVTSKDIAYQDRIKVQGTAQISVDTAISSTINLPKETTIEQVKELYYLAWKEGLKGVTIYRDGSRDPILSTSGFKGTVEQGRVIPHRPKTLNADYYRVKALGEWFHVFVGLHNGSPYEVFAMPITAGTHEEYPQTDKGKITKIKNRVYEFVSENFKINNIALDPEDFKEWRNTTIHVSGMLRHGMPIESIMKLENKCNDVMTSFNKAIWKVLSNYTNAEDLEEKCPVCGGKMVRENGCKHCENGDYSACYFSVAYEED